MIARKTNRKRVLGSKQLRELTPAELTEVTGGGMPFFFRRHHHHHHHRHHRRFPFI